MKQIVKLDRQEWNSTIATLPGAHILQSWEWGDIKEKYGWKANRIIWSDQNCKIYAAAQILERTITPFGIGPKFKVLYVPRGPLLDWRKVKLWSEVLSDLVKIAIDRKAIFIKIDPEVISEPVENISLDIHQILNEDGLKEICGYGWKISPEQIQFKNTLWIDLTLAEDDLLQAMKQKTRYNIRLAERKGVRVRQASESDFSTLYELYAQTSTRDGFIIRPKDYYVNLWQTLYEHRMAEFLVAEINATVVAGLVLFYFAGKAWYFYGMSSELHREKMPNYLLQWGAMRKVKNLGCRLYDLWGAPDEVNENDSMWGVYKFKLGLGGKFIKTIGAWDFPINPIGYHLYHHLLPRILSIRRKIRQKQIQSEISV